MTKHPQHRPALKNLLRDERGAVLIMFTVYLPIIVGFFTLAVDYSYVLRMRNVLQVAAEAGALAATAQLPNPTTSCAQAEAYANANIPGSTKTTIGSYGNVLKTCNDVVLGNWNQQTCPAGQNCFVADSNQTCTGAVQCNAVKVTTRMSAANGNSLVLAFAPLIGISNFSLTAQATAVYGASPGTTWNMEIVNDVSASFAAEYTNGNVQAADLALMNCMTTNSPSGSQLGVTLMTGTGTNFTATTSNPSGMLSVSNASNQTTLTNSIRSIADCQSSNQNNKIPACSGSSFAPAITTALTALTSPSAPAGGQKNIVFITDGQPNCPGNCEAAAITAAQNAATQNGVNISIVYYCGDDQCGSSQSSSSISFLQQLVRGKGVFLNSPTGAQLTAAMSQVCGTQPHRLVW